MMNTETRIVRNVLGHISCNRMEDGPAHDSRMYVLMTDQGRNQLFKHYCYIY